MNDFIKPWDRKSSELDISLTYSMATGSGLKDVVGFADEGGSSPLLRLSCHMLIEMLPDVEIRDLFEEISDRASVYFPNTEFGRTLGQVQITSGSDSPVGTFKPSRFGGVIQPILGQ